ncbi:MAG: translation initiation factor IF-2 [Puniceicoccales bacterium]|jgi:translation initiation factor IF-2|nr:translation initiation factor IF-2 [Puniceicoccales bacterium]
MSMRIYQLSKILGISNRDLVDILRAKGFDVSSASSTVADIYAEELMREYGVHEVSKVEDVNDIHSDCPVNDSAKRKNFEKHLDDAAKDKKSVAKIAIVSNETLLPNDSMKSMENVEKKSSETKEDESIAPLPAPMQKSVPHKSSPIPMKNHGGESMASHAKQSPSLSMAAKPPLQPRMPLLKAPQDNAAERPRIIQLDRLQSSPYASNRRREGPRGNNNGPAVGNSQKPHRDARNGSSTPRHGREGGPRRDERSGKSFSSDFGSRQPRENASGRHPFHQSPELKKISMPIPEIQRKKLSTNAISTTESGGKVLSLKLPRSVREFALDINMKPFQIIAELMRMGIFASMNYIIDEKLARQIGDRFGFQFEVRKAAIPVATNVSTKAPKASVGGILESRPPVVCVLGHVDHGKTTLLDRIRSTNVVSGEAGGITQHVGAYEVVHGGKIITFIDTPGHAAFSKMRERGANVTDIAILVVAADDGFMPQTDEALKLAQRAGVPVIVAINKMDAKGANVERVKQQMQQRNITSEDWGGETLCQVISAINGTGLENLLELILTQAEMMDLRADRSAAARGVIIESQMEIGRGPTASVLMQEGMLKVGDFIVCGSCHCKVRAMVDDRGISVKNALPSKAVKVIGWSEVVEVGAEFFQAENEKNARQLAEKNCVICTAKVGREGLGEENIAVQRRSSRDNEGIEALYAAINAKQKRILRIIIKGDVQGSVEALVSCLSSLPQNKIYLEIVRSEVGNVTRGDVEFAQSIGGIVVAFNVRAENGVQPLLKQHGIYLISHNIIYELVDRVRDAMADLLDPEFREEKLGVAQVRQVFKLSKRIIAGCMVTEGKIVRESDISVRLRSDGKICHEGRLASLRRNKDDVNEVRAGFECGIAIDGFDGYRVDDSIECYRIQKIRPVL